MKLNYKLPLLTGAFLVSSFFPSYSQTQDTIQNKDKKEIEQTEKKKEYNFLERAYINLRTTGCFTKKYRKYLRPDFSKLGELANIRDEKGKRAYSLKELIFLERGDTPLELAELITEKNEKGQNLYTFNDMINITFYKGFSSEKIKKFFSHKDEKGQKVFSSNDLLTYAKSFSLEDLSKEIDNSKNEDPREIAKRLYRKNVESHLKLFDLDSSFYFEDTKKPNALIILPYSDWNGTLKKSLTSRGDDFSLKKLKKNYDIKLSFAEKEEDVYHAIEETPKIEFLVIGGHGSKKSLSLGDTDPRTSKSERDEEYSIDLSDNEFKNYLDMLDSNAVIFLNSCSNAEENLFNKKNLAKFISTMAENKKVVAWDRVLLNKHIKVKNYYPFEITKIKSGGVYYINGKKEEIK